MSDLLSEKTAIRARHIRPGQGQAVEVKAGQFLQIETVQGKQVADFVAFTEGDTEEYLSTAATRSTNGNLITQKGMTLYSNRRQPMFEIVEDTVGRHDMLYICCDPVRYELLGAPGHASCREALTESLTEYGIGIDRIPDPINWFMSVSIQQRGELEIREPIAEAGDYVVLKALKDVVAAVSACPQDKGATNAGNPTDLMIRVFRDEPLPAAERMAGAPEPLADAAPAAAADAVVDEATIEGAEAVPAAPVADAANTQEAPSADGAVPEGVGAAAEAKNPARPARLSDTAEASVLRVENS